MNSQRASWNYRKQIMNFLESTRNRTYTILGMTFIALIVFGAFAIRPTIGTIVKLQNKVENGRIIEQNMQDKIDALSSMQQKIYDNGRKIEQLEEALPLKESLDTIVASVELIAKKYSITVDRLTPTEAGSEAETELSEGGFLTKSVNVDLTGSRENFYDFINQLENIPRIIHINEISIQKSDEAKDMDSLSVSFYFFYRE